MIYLLFQAFSWADSGINFESWVPGCRTCHRTAPHFTLQSAKKKKKTWPSENKGFQLWPDTEGAHKGALYRSGLSEQEHILTEYKLQLAASGLAWIRRFKGLVVVQPRVRKTLTWESTTSGWVASATLPSLLSAGPSCSVATTRHQPLPFIRKDANSLFNHLSPNTTSPVTGTSAYSEQHCDWEVCNVNMLSKYQTAYNQAEWERI